MFFFYFQTSGINNSSTRGNTHSRTQKTWNLSSSAVRTSNLALTSLYSHHMYAHISKVYSARCCVKQRMLLTNTPADGFIEYTVLTVDWLRAGRSGIESRWGRDFLPVQTGPEAHPASCKMGTGSFPGVKCGRGVLLTTLPLLVPRSRKSRAIPLPTL